MKIILTLSILLSGCALKNFPSDPGIKKHYLVDVVEEKSLSTLSYIEDASIIPFSKETVRCIEFDIVSWNPYKIKFVSEVPMQKCNLIGGYAPEDVKKIFNWIEDVYLWADGRKKCFK